MVLKATKAHRLADVVRLRTAADGLPLVVDVNQETGVYAVAFTNDPAYPLITGRYQIVCTYIQGFARGYINRPISEAKETV